MAVPAAVALASALGAGCGGRGGARQPAIAVEIAPAVPATAARTSSPPAPAAPPVAPIELVATPGRLCARVDGRVYCATPSADSPLAHERNAVKGIEGATSLAMGRSFGCAATRDGAALCFGDNHFGQLGGGLRAEKSDAPVRVVGVARARRVFAGPHHACATLEDGTLRCWGRNESGQTGSDTHYAPEARELVAGTEVVGVASDRVACGFSTTCARTARRGVTCWGALPDDSGARRNQRPTPLPGLTDVDEVAAGESAFCASRAGKVLCWGGGRRLVAGAPEGDRAAASVAGITNAKHVSVADDHACALLADGQVACFGYPYSQALGRATDEHAYDAVPSQVVELPRASAITVATGISCALTLSEEIYCWGRWYGDGAAHQAPTPLRIPLR
jgi:hypothetical protein